MKTATPKNYGPAVSRFSLVRMRGLEPPRCHHHRLLRPARLPVPPHPQGTGCNYANGFRRCQLRKSCVREGGESGLYLRNLWFLCRRQSRRSRSKSRSRLRRARLKMFPVKRVLLRLGPRPSHRPSRASWQLTNLPHFLSIRPNTRRFRPWPNASVDIPIASTRTRLAAAISFFIGSFINVLPSTTIPPFRMVLSTTFCRLGIMILYRSGCRHDKR
jgi:hypothetical protein